MKEALLSHRTMMTIEKNFIDKVRALSLLSFLVMIVIPILCSLIKQNSVELK